MKHFFIKIILLFLIFSPILAEGEKPKLKTYRGSEVTRYYDCRLNSPSAISEIVCQAVELNRKMAQIKRRYSQQADSLMNEARALIREGKTKEGQERLDKAELLQQKASSNACGYFSSDDYELDSDDHHLIQQLIYLTNKKNRPITPAISQLEDDLDNIEQFVKAGRRDISSPSEIIIKPLHGPGFYISDYHNKVGDDGKLIYSPQPVRSMKLQTLSRCIDNWTRADRDIIDLVNLPAKIRQGYLDLLDALNTQK